MIVVGIGSATLAAQGPVATFSSGIDLVRVSAVVRDHKGRFVQDLTVSDFEILDNDKAQTTVAPASNGIARRVISYLPGMSLCALV